MGIKKVKTKIERYKSVYVPLLLLLTGYRKSSVCVICMKYRIIILLNIIISLGQIILLYIAHHARTPTRAHTRPPAAVVVQVVAVRWRPTMMELTPLFAGSAGDQWAVASSLK